MVVPNIYYSVNEKLLRHCGCQLVSALCISLQFAFKPLTPFPLKIRGQIYKISYDNLTIISYDNAKVTSDL